jgi:hypothetical protein
LLYSETAKVCETDMAFRHIFTIGVNPMKNFRSLIVVLFVFVILSVITGCGIEPQAPLQITRRDSLATAFFEGKRSSVLIFTNLSDEHLSVTLNAIAKDGNRQSWTFDLLPHEQGKEIGVLETGWAFESGETIKVSVPGYRIRTEKIP